MTNLEALKAAVNYPISTNQATLALLDRSLTPADTYTAVSKEFELAKADILMLLISSANIAEGGYSISMTDKSNMMKMASQIYTKHGVSNPLAPQIKDASNRW